MTVKELLGRLDSHEFGEWMAYDKIAPFGDQRADLRAAIGHRILYNANRGKRQPVRETKDFMPFIDKTETDGATGKQGAALARQLFRKG